MSVLELAYKAIKDLSESSAQVKLLHSIILTEAKINNDLASAILTIFPSSKDIDLSLLSQFETSTFDLMTTFGFTYEKLFEDRKAINISLIFEDSEEIDSSKIENKSNAELYNFYIRKSIILKKLSKSGSVLNSSINLKTRVKNIQLATKLLIKKSKEV